MARLRAGKSGERDASLPVRPDSTVTARGVAPARARDVDGEASGAAVEGRDDEVRRVP